MRNNRILYTIMVVGLILCVIAAVCIYLVFDRMNVFNGSRIKNPDKYFIEFTNMNQTDTAVMKLNEGDVLEVSFLITKGRADITIGLPQEKPIYKGNDIDSGSFNLEITESGEYTIEISAKHAAGEVLITIAE